MTYPADFQSQTKTIGPSQTLHPMYLFQVNLDLNASEVIGPNTNAVTVNLLHPDQHQSSPDLGRTQRVVRKLQNLTWFPNFLAGGNIEINDDGTITAYGSQGTYLYNTFTAGATPLLTTLNVYPFTTLTVPQVAPASDNGPKARGTATVTCRYAKVGSGGAYGAGAGVVAFTDN